MKIKNFIRLTNHKSAQGLEEHDIPEEYKEKVKKLKSLGLEYVPKEYKTVEQHFNIWKKWTIEHEVTPSKRSQNKKEERIARNMTAAFTKMKKLPEEYKTY